MPSAREFRATFRALRRQFRAKSKKQFLTDIEEQIGESEELQEILDKPRGEPRIFAVTADRKKNDKNFLYGYFDMLLVAMDAASGGSGIRKPINQMRCLQWDLSSADLFHFLMIFRKNNPQVAFRRVLVTPYPQNPRGWRLDPKIYKR